MGEWVIQIKADPTSVSGPVLVEVLAFDAEEQRNLTLAEVRPIIDALHEMVNDPDYERVWVRDMLGGAEDDEP